MDSGSTQFSAVLMALGFSLLSASSAHGNRGLNCGLGAVQINLPMTGKTTDPLKAASAQIQVECSPTPNQPSSVKSVAHSTYPTNSKAGQVTWGTDHRPTTGLGQKGIVVRRSDGLATASDDPTSR